MPDLLHQAATWLNAKREAHLATDVEYRRGAAAVSVPATVGRTVVEQTDEAGLLVRFVTRDYLISAERLVLPGESLPAEPRLGDEIVETLPDGRRFVHRVISPGSGEPPWRYSDPARTTLRIHTKHTATVNPSP